MFFVGLAVLGMNIEKKQALRYWWQETGGVELHQDLISSWCTNSSLWSGIPIICLQFTLRHLLSGIGTSPKFQTSRTCWEGCCNGIDPERLTVFAIMDGVKSQTRAMLGLDCPCPSSDSPVKGPFPGQLCSADQRKGCCCLLSFLPVWSCTYPAKWFVAHTQTCGELPPLVLSPRARQIKTRPWKGILDRNLATRQNCKCLFLKTVTVDCHHLNTRNTSDTPRQLYFLCSEWTRRTSAESRRKHSSFKVTLKFGVTVVYVLSAGASHPRNLQKTVTNLGSVEGDKS